MLKVEQNCAYDEFVLGSKIESKLAAKSVVDCGGCSIDEMRVEPDCVPGCDSKSMFLSDVDGVSMLRLDIN